MNVLKPLGIATAISVVVGLLFYSSFLQAFGITMVVQFIAFNMFQMFLNVWGSLENKKLENERIAEFSKQGLEVTCPCHKKVEAFVPIELNTENTYTCRECNHQCRVLIEPQTVLMTAPVATGADPLDQLSLNLKDEER